MSKALLWICIILFLAVCIWLTVLYIKYLIEENKKEKEELQAVKKQSEEYKKYLEEVRKNEEKLVEVHSGNKLNNFNAGIELLQEQSAKGEQRNS